MRTDQLKLLIQEYVSYIETAPTSNICKCTWLYRDGIVNGKPKSAIRVRTHEHSECMQHTKTGLILGFTEWLVATAKVPSRRITLPHTVRFNAVIRENSERESSRLE